MDFESETLIVGPLQHNGRPAGSAIQQDAESGMLVAHALTGEGHDASEDGDPMFSLQRGKQHAVAYRNAGDGVSFEEGDKAAPLNTQTDRTAHVVAFDTTQITSGANRSNPQDGDPSHPLASRAHAPAIAFTERTCAEGRTLESQEDVAYALTNPGSGGRTHSRQIAQGWAVRRLTPVECAKLQGFSNLHCHIKLDKARKIVAEEAEYLMSHGIECHQDANGEWRTFTPADGPIYKAYGNAMAVPVVGWILGRIKRKIETGSCT